VIEIFLGSSERANSIVPKKARPERIKA
jgi:hypothetical protein